MKRKLIALICIIALMLPMAILPASALPAWTTVSAPANIDYSFVVFGDMQSMTWTDNIEGTTYVKSAFDWILDNKDSRKIEYVFGLGDTVDTLTTYSTNVVQGNGKTQNVNEWILASTQIHRLDGVIPYTITRGNHDDEGGYHKYICTEEYTNQMSGFYYDPSKPATLGNSMSNCYRKIVIGGQRYLMLSLDYNADSNVIAWANEVIASNPYHRVIASVHAYLDGEYSGGKGVLAGSNNGFLSGTIGAANANNSAQVNTAFNGENLWNNLFSKHENVFMVLCGHDAIPSPVHNTRTGVNGNKVIEILTDTSKYDLEKETSYGANFVMVLNFREGSNQLEIEYLSPSRKAAGFSNYHLSGEQISFTYTDIETPDVLVEPETLETASVRISTTAPGLRFKSNILKADLEELIETFGKANVKVGTLIAPKDKLTAKELTHSFGTKGTDYVEVMATLDQPFADEGDYLVYAGSLSKIKQENIGREFTAVGFIAYNDGTGFKYIYSNSTATRSVDYVATAALNDNSANYTLAQLAVLEQLTVKYHQDAIVDPFGKDPF